MSDDPQSPPGTGRGNRTERRGHGFARGSHVPPRYSLAQAIREAHANLDGERVKYPPVRASRLLLATVKAWQVELPELRAKAAQYEQLYERLVADWNAVCEALTELGIEVYSLDGITWLWSWRSLSGEAASAGAAAAAALLSALARGKDGHAQTDQ